MLQINKKTYKMYKTEDGYYPWDYGLRGKKNTFEAERTSEGYFPIKS